LTGIAIEKAGRMHKQLTPARVFVVADAPRDMEATKKAGAVSVGVATSHYSVDELAQAGADHVLHSLADPFPGI
jgi:phosphoglycolate phosphatase